MPLNVLRKLLFPHTCVGCGCWDQVLCAECFALVCPPPDEIAPWKALELDWDKDSHEGDAATENTLDTPHWSVGEYAGVLRRFLLAAKHRPDIRLEDALLECGYTLGVAMAQSQMWQAEPWSRRDAWVVPAPSCWRRRYAGREVALPLAVGVAKGLCDSLGINTIVVEACALRWGAGSQSGRSGAARRGGRHRAMKLRCPLPEDASLVVVDDIVTTGATIAEMLRCMGKSADGVASLCHVTTR